MFLSFQTISCLFLNLETLNCSVKSFSSQYVFQDLLLTKKSTTQTAAVLWWKKYKLFELSSVIKHLVWLTSLQKCLILISFKENRLLGLRVCELSLGQGFHLFVEDLQSWSIVQHPLQGTLTRYYLFSLFILFMPLSLHELVYSRSNKRKIVTFFFLFCFWYKWKIFGLKYLCRNDIYTIYENYEIRG